MALFYPHYVSSPTTPSDHQSLGLALLKGRDQLGSILFLSNVRFGTTPTSSNQQQPTTTSSNQQQQHSSSNNNNNKNDHDHDRNHNNDHNQQQQQQNEQFKNNKSCRWSIGVYEATKFSGGYDNP